MTVDYNLRSLIGFLSSGSVSLILLPISILGMFDSSYYQTSVTDIIGGLFFYALTLFFFLSFIFSFSQFERFNRVIVRFSSDLFFLYSQRFIVGVFVFLLSGLPTTSVFFFKFSSFDTLLFQNNIFFLLLVILFQMVFACIYVRLLLSLFSSQFLLSVNSVLDADEGPEEVDTRFCNNRRGVFEQSYRFFCTKYVFLTLCLLILSLTDISETVGSSIVDLLF
jgi:hypothetical protein